MAVTSGRLRARKELENYLSEKVESMLETVVGNGNVMARVSAKIATDSETITSEIYENENPITKQCYDIPRANNGTWTSPGGPV